MINEIDEVDIKIKNLIKKKKYLLINLWKEGLSKKMRKIIWPIMIGNNKEITIDLY